MTASDIRCDLAWHRLAARLRQPAWPVRVWHWLTWRIA